MEIHCRRLHLSGVWKRIRDRLREQVRIKAGNAPTPTVLDSQTVKMTEMREAGGFNGGKLITGRKRHIVMDKLGLVLAVVVHAAKIQDRTGAELGLVRMQGYYPWNLQDVDRWGLSRAPGRVDLGALELHPGYRQVQRWLDGLHRAVQSLDRGVHLLVRAL